MSIFYTVISHLLFYKRTFEKSLEFANVADDKDNKYNPPNNMPTLIKLFQLPP